MSTVPNPANDSTTIEVADGHVVHLCCGRVDTEPHRNFCKHYQLADEQFRAGYAEGYIDAILAARSVTGETGSTCPDWCDLTHDAEDDARDDLALHMGGDLVDGTVRKLLDGHRLEVQVARTDCPSEGRVGKTALSVRCEVDLTTWEQAAELARTILDAFGYLKD